MSFYQRQALIGYMRRQFGVTDIHDPESVQNYYRDFNENTRGSAYESDGYSKVFHLLKLKVGERIDRENLRRFDRNIRRHLEQMNRRREPSIQLKYFQLLAGFYTEYYLDKITNHKASFLQEINTFVRQENEKMDRRITYPVFDESDLNKIAFWMATGSGKTLIMHLNYYQFLHYMQAMDQPPPNAGLTEQHMKELHESGIPNAYYLHAAGRTDLPPDIVKVIEITKLTEDKTGSGDSVEVDYFEGQNLIFVDEGHKGISSGAWKKYRDDLSNHGFAFEYSATFGQALNRNNTPASVKDEYGKVILFDYSYPRFYDDGYGKDYRILNLKTNQEFDDNSRRTYLLANLLTFFEQQYVYQQKPETFYKKWNIAEPLQVFIGHSVQAKRSVYDERVISDVLELLLFLKEVLENDQNWVVETLKNLLQGNSGITRADGTDLFMESLDILKDAYKQKEDDLYRAILQSVFHVSGPVTLHLVDLKSAPGEIALRAGGSEHYFGVINIGDDRLFLNSIEESFPEISMEKDTFSDSLFQQINSRHSFVNILIGAKKFIEGWSSWRVSSMGLMNIGKTEGPQIIQLFGRGVRLLGKNRSLKRSDKMKGGAPSYIQTLETLQIFGMEANYMEEFQEYLHDEGIDTEERVNLHLDIEMQDHFKKEGLLVPRPKERDDFVDVSHFVLEVDKTYKPIVNLSRKIEEKVSGDRVEERVQAEYSGSAQKIPSDVIDMMNQHRLYRQCWSYRQQKNYLNLGFDASLLKEVLIKGYYDLVAEDDLLQAETIEDIHRLEEVALIILRKYIDRYYKQQQQQWEYQQLAYEPVTTSDPNIPTAEEGRPGYVLQVKRKVLPKIEQELKQILNDRKELEKTVLNSQQGSILRIYYDRHLYLPLLLADAKEVYRSIPQGLNEGEWRFVEDLRDYLNDHHGDEEWLSKFEFYLLRNQTRGNGVGFLLEENRYFPDFILWLKGENEQHICFVDPKGLVQQPNLDKNRKVQFAKHIKEYEEQLQKTTDNKVYLHAAIISQTGIDDLRKMNDYESFVEYNNLNVFMPSWLKKGGQDGYIKAMLYKILESK